MNDLRMVFKHECKCGHILKIDTEKYEKCICPNCGEIVFEKVKDSVQHAKGKVKK